MTHSPKEFFPILIHMLNVGLMEGADKKKLTDMPAIAQFLKNRMNETQEEARKGLDMLTLFPALRDWFSPEEIAAYEHFAGDYFLNSRKRFRFSSNP